MATLNEIQDLEFQDNLVIMTIKSGSKVQVVTLPLEAFMLHPYVNHQRLNKDELTAIQNAVLENEAYEYSLRLLTKQDYCSYVLKERLSKRYSEPIIDKVIQRLKHNRILDDNAYVLSFFENKTQKAIAAARVALELQEKGFPEIDAKIIDKYSKGDAKMADVFAKKYLKIYAKLPIETRRIRLYRQLLNRGYSEEIIKLVFKTNDLGDLLDY